MCDTSFKLMRGSFGEHAKKSFHSLFFLQVHPFPHRKPGGTPTICLFGLIKRWQKNRFCFLETLCRSVFDFRKGSAAR